MAVSVAMSTRKIRGKPPPADATAAGQQLQQRRQARGTQQEAYGMADVVPIAARTLAKGRAGARAKASKQPRGSGRPMLPRSPYDPIAVGRRLRMIRYVLGYPDGMADQFANEQMGMPPSTWNGWETGKLKRGIPIDSLRKLRQLLPGISYNWIIDGELGEVSFPVREKLALVPPHPYD